jgi:DMSO/TMAO reductase YedYZ molybdopterin-dependent catalytic subunit
MTPQRTDGLTSNSEWTGVPVATLFREAGLQRSASWFLAEGADACLMTRSIPVEKALDDALVVWAQNGEPLRPEQGFPLRLLLPGWEGNANVKWLRRPSGTRPWMTLGDLEVHGSIEGRHGADFQLRHGREVDHHFTVGAIETDGPWLACRLRRRLVGPGSHNESRGQRRQRSHLARRRTARARASEGPYPLFNDVELGWKSGGAAEPRH